MDTALSHLLGEDSTAFRMCQHLSRRTKPGLVAPARWHPAVTMNGKATGPFNWDLDHAGSNLPGELRPLSLTSDRCPPGSAAMGVMTQHGQACLPACQMAFTLHLVHWEAGRNHAEFRLVAGERHCTQAAGAASNSGNWLGGSSISFSQCRLL